MHMDAHNTKLQMNNIHIENVDKIEHLGASKIYERTNNTLILLSVLIVIIGLGAGLLPMFLHGCYHFSISR